MTFMDALAFYDQLDHTGKILWSIPFGIGALVIGMLLTAFFDWINP